MINTYKICIASYDRARSQCTLDLLEKLDVPKENIFMSVQTQKNEKEYAEAGIANRVNELIYKEGQSASDNRNTLLDHFSAGEKIVFLDDDLLEIYKLEIQGKKKKLAPITCGDEFWKLFNYGFGLTAIHKTVGFGLSIYSNPFYMQPGYKTKAICSTAVYGVINTDLRFNSDIKIFEDAAMCCEIMKRYGKFIMLNCYTTKHKSWLGCPGGCKEDWKEKGKYAKI